MYFSVLFMFNFDANAQSMTIEEVIVSAEKREESLQDISQSVTALTEEELETKNITDFVGLSDPFVTLDLGNKFLRTQTCYNTLEPKWNQDFKL